MTNLQLSIDMCGFSACWRMTPKTRILVVGRLDAGHL